MLVVILNILILKTVSNRNKIGHYWPNSGHWSGSLGDVFIHGNLYVSSYSEYINFKNEQETNMVRYVKIIQDSNSDHYNPSRNHICLEIYINSSIHIL